MSECASCGVETIMLLGNLCMSCYEPEESKVSSVDLRERFVYPKDHSALGLCSHSAVYINEQKLKDLVKLLETYLQNGPMTLADFKQLTKDRV
jgi:NMD protein affecting ribosome stability and mRNA decay